MNPIAFRHLESHGPDYLPPSQSSNFLVARGRYATKASLPPVPFNGRSTPRRSLPPNVCLCLQMYIAVESRHIQSCCTALPTYTRSLYTEPGATPLSSVSSSRSNLHSTMRSLSLSLSLSAVMEAAFPLYQDAVLLQSHVKQLQCVTCTH